MPVKNNSTGTVGNDQETVVPMKDGEKLKLLLEKHGKKPGDLEKAVGKSRQMVHIYLTTPRYTANMRDTLRRALDKMGIDPAELAEDPTAITDPAELRRLLERIPNDALVDLKRMLEIQDRSTKMGLLALIDDRIERGPKIVR